MRMEHWWNDTEWGKPTYPEKILCQWALALRGLSHGTAPTWQISVWSYDSATDNRDSGLSWLPVRGGADKSLDRSGRKQATATKLWIHSTYSPRCSIHFLTRCSNFCKPPSFWRWHTMGACSPNVSIRMAWISSGAMPCGGGGLDDSSRLHVVEIARVAWHASFQPLYQEKLAIRQMNRPFFPTTLSIPSYIGK